LRKYLNTAISAVNIFKTFGEKRGLAYALKTLGEINYKLGYHDKAFDNLTMSQSILTRIGIKEPKESKPQVTIG